MMNVPAKALDECLRLFSRCAREASSRMLNCRLQPKAQLNKLRGAAARGSFPESHIIRRSAVNSDHKQKFCRFCCCFLFSLRTFLFNCCTNDLIILADVVPDGLLRLLHMGIIYSRLTCQIEGRQAGMLQ